ncbi:MAG TPA: hypothetical protein VG271_19330 [Beijerinckiaceae bacterium]|jgi:phosphatidylglycerophosphate synthase|nr:hypothetical protein [Beijerinckiaceae bacterium]
MSLSRFIPVFTAAFAVIYVPTMSWNWPVFTYLPRSGTFALFKAYAELGDKAPGPGMYFWGWIVTAAIGAAIVAFLASFVPEKVASRISVGWVPIFPIGAILCLIYVLRPWWTH